MRFVFKLFILLAVLVVPVSALAQSSTIYASADVDMTAQAATANFGSSERLFVSNSAVTQSNSFINFDLSSIPAGSKINLATLAVNVYYNNAMTSKEIKVNRISSRWDESSLTFDNQPQVGDFVTGTIKTGIRAYAAIEVTNFINSTVNNSADWYGFRLSADAGDAWTVAFQSRESADNVPPMLTVDYTPPTGAVVTTTPTATATSSRTASNKVSNVIPADTSTVAASDSVSPVTESEAAAEPSEGGRSWIWYVLAAVVLVGAGLAYFFLKRKKALSSKPKLDSTERA